MIRKLTLCLLVLILAACNLSTAPDSESGDANPTDGLLIVAWEQDGSLMLWTQGDESPRRIATSGVIRPYLAPDGQHIVFTRGPLGTPETLWVADTAGAAEQELVGRDGLRAFRGGQPLIGQIVWFDETVLYFNTLQAGDVHVSANNDLYRVNIRTREVAMILPPTEGGEFSISPDRQYIAVVYPGTYGRQDGVIRVVDPLGQADKNLLYFVGVSTASEYDFYPQLYWRPDSSAVLTTIPDKDLVYDDVGAKPAALWNLPVEVPQERSTLGTVPASFFGLPRWSDTGTYMTYMQRVGDATSNRFELLLADSDGENAASYASGTAGTLQPPQWIPGADRFVFSQGETGIYWLGAPGDVPKRFPNKDETLLQVLFADENVYVFATASGEGEIELRYANLESIGAPSTLIANAGQSLPVFDAIIVPDA